MGAIQSIANSVNFSKWGEDKEHREEHEEEHQQHQQEKGSVSEKGSTLTKLPLASLARVSRVVPHPKASHLDIVCVGSRNVIAPQNRFAKDDMCIYIAPGAFLPESPKYDFMQKYGYKVKAIRIRGVLSDGLALPLAYLPPHFPSTSEYLKHGTDLTRDLGINSDESYYKDGMNWKLLPTFEANESRPTPVRWNKILSKPIPSEIPSCKIDRIQHVVAFLEKDARRTYVVLEDVQGVNSNYSIMSNGDFVVCSTNRQIMEDDAHVWAYAKDSSIEQKLRTLSVPITIQGVLIGPKINGNPYFLPENSPYVFMIRRIYSGGLYLSWSEVKDIAKMLKLRTLPTVQIQDKAPLKSLVSPTYDDPEDEFAYNVQQNMAKGVSILNENIARCGVIISSQFGSPNLFFRIQANVVSKQFYDAEYRKWKEIQYSEGQRIRNIRNEKRKMTTQGKEVYNSSLFWCNSDYDLENMPPLEPIPYDDQMPALI